MTTETRRFREVRKALDFTLDQARAAVGVKSVATIHNYEKAGTPAGRADLREGMSRYAQWLVDQAIVNNRPELVLTLHQFAPDVFPNLEEVAA